jgi:hypothetical protein
MAGPSVVAIPEAMFPNIVPLLERHDIDCEVVPLADSDDPEHFLLLLRCSRADVSVRASVQREPHVNPNGPIIVYDGVYKGRQHSAETIALLDAITDIFTDNGAWIPVRDAS